MIKCQLCCRSISWYEKFCLVDCKKSIIEKKNSLIVNNIIYTDKDQISLDESGGNVYIGEKNLIKL